MNLMGLDIGTTGCKAIVFDKAGDVLGHGFREYSVISTSEGYNEQDSELVWSLAKEAMAEAVQKSGVTELLAISISVQGDAVIPIDQNNNAMHNAILGMDYRTTKEVEKSVEVMGDRALFDITGMRPHPMNSATKMMWFKENKPKIYDGAKKLVTYADFIMCKLGSEPVIDYTMASRTMLFDLEQKQWNKEILSKLHIDECKLSKPVPSGEIVGEMCEKLAYELGIKSVVHLVSGGHDQTCAALGAGVIKENIALDSHGTAEVLSAAFDKIRISDKMYSSYYPCYCHTVEGKYFTFALNHVGGILFKWFRDNFCEQEMIEADKLGVGAYMLLEEKATNEPSDILILPHFNGSGTPWCDLKSKGAIIGLTMSSTKYDVVKAILDSLTYELKMNIAAFHECGIKIDTLRAVGGATKSPKWMQIKADITGKEVQTLKVADAACLGAAILAGVATKVFDDIPKAVQICVKLGKVYTPNPQKVLLYEQKFNVYKDLYDTLKNINHRL